MKNLLVVLLIFGLAGCASVPVKENTALTLSSLATIDGQELIKDGHFKTPTLLVALDFSCSHCQEAAKRMSEWIIPELKDYDFNVVGIARLHDAADLKQWREGLGITFDLVADPEKSVLKQLGPIKGLPSFIFVSESGKVVFRYSGWNSEVGRTLVSDLKYVLEAKNVANKNSLVNEVFVLSSLEKTLDSMSVQIMRELEALKGNMPDDMYEALKKNAEEKLNLEDWKTSFKHTMAANLSYSTINDIIAWENSKLGKRFKELDKVSYEEGFIEKVKAYSESLKENPPPQHRIELMRKIDDLVGGSSMITEISVKSAIGYSTVINSLKPIEEQATFDQIKSHFISLSPQIHQANKAALVAILMYAYESASDSELNQYIDKLETKSGREFSSVTARSFSSVLSKYNMELMKGMREILEKYQGLKGV